MTPAFLLGCAFGVLIGVVVTLYACVEFLTAPSAPRRR